MLDRLKTRLALWVIDAIEDYGDEHGQEMLDKAIAWLRSQVVNFDGELFASAPPIEGREDFCTRQRAKLEVLLTEDNQDA